MKRAIDSTSFLGVAHATPESMRFGQVLGASGAYDKPPEFVYKYCRRNIYNEFLSRGKFRLGTINEYRKSYEYKASGLLDPHDGIITQFPIGAGYKVQAIPNGHIFCVSKSYSEDVHLAWWRREDCRYNLCIKLHSETFFKSLIAEVTKVQKDGFKQLGSCVYGEHFYSNKIAIDIMRTSFYKLSKYQHEDEYRFVSHINDIRNDKPLFVELGNIDECIVDVMNVNLSE